jgi:hypothetical protein
VQGRCPLGEAILGSFWSMIGRRCRVGSLNRLDPPAKLPGFVQQIKEATPAAVVNQLLGLGKMYNLPACISIGCPFANQHCYSFPVDGSVRSSAQRHHLEELKVKSGMILPKLGASHLAVGSEPWTVDLGLEGLHKHSSMSQVIEPVEDEEESESRLAEAQLFILSCRVAGHPIDGTRRDSNQTRRR